MSAEILVQYEQRPDEYNPLATHPNPEALYLESLTQGTLLAGREKPFTWELDAITSEGALHRYRAQVEVEALINLAERGPVEIDISDDEKETLRGLYSPENFNAVAVIMLDHLGVKDPEDPRKDRKPLEHDVKAVEVYLADQLDELGLGHLKEWVHFGMTSEDTNNLAYNLMLRDATNKVLVPSITRVADRLANITATFADAPVLGITHAQKASPTTIGKQFGYLLSNITKTAAKLGDLRLSGKFSGAVGNHNPMVELFREFDYDAYAQDFVESFGFDYAPIQNQRNDHLSVTEFLDATKNLAVVGKDTADNIWLQILDGRIRQRLVEGEKGSSTMSHKINPWRLENSEAIFEQAIGLLGRATEGLVASRHERDLSDHDWQRAYGDMIGRVVAGYNYLAVQLDRLTIDPEIAKQILSESAEVLSELLQTAGRVSGDPDAYDNVVALTQGRRLDLAAIHEIAEGSLPDGDIKDRVMGVTPESYVGTAAEQARKSVLGWHGAKLILSRGVLDESKSVDAVLFDLDDTLHFGVKDEVRAKLAHIFAGFDSGFSDERIAEYAKMHNFREMRDLMIADHNDRNPNNKITTEDFDAASRETTGMFDHLLHAPKESKEVINLLKNAGKLVGLVTTRGGNTLDHVLELHGFTGLFDSVFGGAHVTRRKPHPEPLALAINELAVLPERSLYVGDDQDVDVLAARGLGMKTALIGTNPLDPLGPTPTYHWPNLTQLGRIYGR